MSWALSGALQGTRHRGSASRDQTCVDPMTWQMAQKDAVRPVQTADGKELESGHRRLPIHDVEPPGAGSVGGSGLSPGSVERMRHWFSVTLVAAIVRPAKGRRPPMALQSLWEWLAALRFLTGS